MSSSNTVNNSNNETTCCGNYHHLDPVLDDETASPNNYYMTRFNEVGSSPDMSESARRNANTKNTYVSNPFLGGTPCLSKSLSGMHQQTACSLSSNKNLSGDMSGFMNNNGQSSALSEIVEAARDCNNKAAPFSHHLHCDTRQLDPLRTISKKHSITLSDSVIDKLNAERVIESGEFEVLDSARLAEIGIKSREDRIKVLKLIKLHNNEELSELQTQFDRGLMRSQLQAHSFLLHLERLSLVAQMPALVRRVRFMRALNCAFIFYGRARADVTNDDFRYSVEEHEEAISYIKKSKLREKDPGSFFFRQDPLIQAKIDAAIARIIARREEKDV